MIRMCHVMHNVTSCDDQDVSCDYILDQGLLSTNRNQQ